MRGWIAVLLAGVLAGCTGPATAGGGPSTAPADTGMPCATHDEGRPLPGDFVPVSAARCVLVDDGSRDSATWIREEQVARGGLDALVRALRLPSEPRQALPCPMPVPIGITLTDRHGTSVVPDPPRNFCGLPLSAVQDAIDALHWQVISRTRVPRT